MNVFEDGFFYLKGFDGCDVGDGVEGDGGYFVVKVV